MVMLLRLVEPPIVALTLVKITVLVPVPGLNVPLLIHAPAPLLIVNCELTGAFTIPFVSIFNEPNNTVGFKVGSLGVVAASGMYTIVRSDGVAFGVQFVAVVQESLTDPFQVKELVADSSRVNKT